MQWVLTNPESTMIYGTVSAENEVEAAQRVDAGMGIMFWQSGVTRDTPLVPVAALSLTDGRWREAAPGTALPGGDCGGDIQISDAFGRRFWLALPGGDWAMINIDWYLTDDTDVSVRPRGRGLDRREEYMILSDIHNPGDSEIWSDIRYLTESSFPLTEEGVLQAVADFAPEHEIAWHGRPFR